MNFIENKKNKILLILVIFVIALLPRIITVLNHINISPQDIDGYDALAMNILKAKGFSMDGRLTSYHEPFYSAFLSVIYYFFGHSFLAVRIIQAILGAITCVIIFLISERIFNPKMAIMAALISIFNPGFIKSSLHLMTENIFTFLFAIAIFFLIKQIQGHNFKNLLILGITLGIATLTRSSTILFPIFILLLLGKKLVPQNFSFKRYSLSIFIFVLSFILPILPWTLRNWRVHHRFLPICSKLGVGLYSSYVPKEGKLYGFTINDKVTGKATLLDSEVEQSNFLLKETLKYIKKNLALIPKLELLKTAYFWSPFDWEIIGYGVYNFMYGFIFPFFIYGLFINFNRLRELLPVYLPIVYTFLIALITYGSPRFRLPIEPYLIIIATTGISRFILSFSNWKYGLSLTGFYFFLNLFFYSNSYQLKVLVRDFFRIIHLW